MTTQPKGLVSFSAAVLLGGLAVGLLAPGCGDNDGHTNTNLNFNVNTTISGCESVRLTHYTAGADGWCEFSRTLSVLPDFVQNGMTFAIAEPWNGGSYGGDPGEACGECWEVHTSWGTQIVMMHDLCPIQGNPICAGSHLHFDLSEEAADTVQAAGLDAAATRRVPCPVSGNIHVSIKDWNEWGYQRLAFVNHRIPIRHAASRATPDGTWIPFERSGGAWHVLDGPRPGDGDGVAYRLESAQGQVVASVTGLPFSDVEPGGSRLVADIGIQFDDIDPSTGTCEYVPPGLVYGDEYGGIDEVRWQANPWGNARVIETPTGCHEGSASCLQVEGLGDWGGLHLYYWQGFPGTTFTTLTIWARTLSGSMPLRAGPSHDGTLCGEQEITVTTEWAAITFDLPSACAGVPILSTVTFQAGGSSVPLLLDDILFEQ